MTVLDCVQAATSRLVEAGLPHEVAAFDAEVLARHALGWDRTAFVCNRREAAPPTFPARYGSLLGRRLRREPVALIVGCREFWGLDFEVDRSVLTPRPETELLVEETIRLAHDHQLTAPAVVDVGTGSGCVAIAVARELGGARVVGTDVSEAALVVARRNAERHGVSHRIDWVRGWLLDGVATTPDMIVANPPYIAETNLRDLPPEVRDYEPQVALAGGADGLDVIRALVESAARRLAEGGHLVMEFGAGQADAVRHCIGTRPDLSVIRIRHDLQGIPRSVVAQRHASS